jgi:YbbR-like protein
MSWLLANWPLKLASVAAALALWLFVTATERTRTVLQAPVDYVGLGADAVLVGPRIDTVDVEIEAVRWLAARLPSRGIRARVDVASLPEGNSAVALSPTNVAVPPGASVLRITPGRVEVTVARALRERVRVVPDIHGRPAPGFAIGRVSIEPESVQIEGPRSTIEGREVVSTMPVDVTGARISIAQSVGLALPPAVAAPRERAVRVTVEIRAEEAMQHGDSRR